MAFDDLVAAGMLDLNQGDQVEITTHDGDVVAGPLTVKMAICAIGDWIHLTNPDGTTYTHLSSPPCRPFAWRQK